jgi:hypothetical protein
MSVSYDSYSPYYDTDIDTNGRLGIWQPRAVPVSSDDKQITISAAYNYRPDLLAYDMYGDSRLWWVFAVRNPNVLVEEPINNFIAGVKIFIPDSTTLLELLGS